MFLCLSAGSYFLLGNLALTTAPTVKKAALHRGGVKATWMQTTVTKLASKLVGHISVSDELKRQRLLAELAGIGSPDSPEQFLAVAAATAILYALIGALLMVISPMLGLALAAAMGGYVYTKKRKMLTAQSQKRREAIEMELPQFARTIRQSLNSTRDVVQIMESYRKIGGPVLRKEIDRTLNDLKTGNAHRALMAFDARVNSSQVSALVRGLIGLLQGDDQRNYFERVADDCAKAQDELIKRELQKRPGRLNANGWCVLLCYLLMILVAVGGGMLPIINTLF